MDQLIDQVSNGTPGGGNMPASIRDKFVALAGKEKLIVAGHDPQVADRFQQMEPGIIKIA